MLNHKSAGGNRDTASPPDLRWVLSPVEYSTFVDSYWSRAPLRINRNCPGYHEQLLSERDLEYTLQVAAKTPGALEEMVGEDRPRRCANYASAVESFKRGKSLRIDGIQRFSRDLVHLCRALEQDFSCPVNINMYLTPGAKQALARHYDTHDVFVLQIHGQKRWRLFDSPVLFPMEYLPPLRCEPRTKSFRVKRPQDMAQRDNLKITDEFVLQSGDLLYLPRGFWHEAEAEADSVSCHLTIGVQSFTYADLLTVAVAQAAALNPGLRCSLPMGFGTHTDCRSIVRQHASDLVKKLPELIEVENSLDQVSEIFIRSRQTGDARLLHSSKGLSNDLSLTSKLRIRDGIVCGVSTTESQVTLTFGTTTLALPATYESTFRFIARMRSFIPAEFPGDLEDIQRLWLAQQLITEGLLTNCDSGLDTIGSGEERQMNGWLPIRLAPGPERPTVKWQYFGEELLTEPFFAQSVSRIKHTSGARMRVTTVKALANTHPGIPPSGFVFHISRCGSTLVSNSLREAEGTVVVSEAQPFGEALAPSDGESALQAHGASNWDEVLKGLIRAFGQARTGNEKALVIKFSSWNILHLNKLRRLWPEVPIVIVIRDPLEVMVSCLEQPPGWMRQKQKPRAASKTFGWDEKMIAAMTDEQYCAKAIGAFLQVACASVSPLCRVVDYAGLNAETMLDIADFFGLAAPNRERIEEQFSKYSKDPGGNRMFSDDSERKRSLVTGSMRYECKEWAQDLYDRLKRQQFMIQSRLTTDTDQQCKSLTR